MELREIFAQIRHKYFKLWFVKKKKKKTMYCSEFTFSSKVRDKVTIFGNGDPNIAVTWHWRIFISELNVCAELLMGKTIDIEKANKCVPPFPHSRKVFI